MVATLVPARGVETPPTKLPQKAHVRFTPAQQKVLRAYSARYSQSRFERFYREVTVGLGSQLVMDHVEDAGRGGSREEYCACGHNGLRWLFLTRPKEGRLADHLVADPTGLAETGQKGWWWKLGKARIHERSIKGEMLQIGSECITRVMGISDAEARQLIAVGLEVAKDLETVGKALEQYGTFAAWRAAVRVDRYLDPPDAIAAKTRKWVEAFLAVELPLPTPLLRKLRKEHDAAAVPGAIRRPKEYKFLAAYEAAGLRSTLLAEFRQRLAEGKDLSESQLRVVGWAMGDLPLDKLPKIAKAVLEDENLVDLVADTGVHGGYAQLVEACRKRLHAYDRAGTEWGWFQHPLWDEQRERLFKVLTVNKAAVAALDAGGDLRVYRARDYWLARHPAPAKAEAKP